MEAVKMAKRGDGGYLFKRGFRWYVAVEVPPLLRSRMGTKRITKALHTDDERQAQILKHRVVGELKASIERVRQGHAYEESGGITGRAMLLRRELEEANLKGDYDRHNDLKSVLWISAEQVERETGTANAKSFADIASGVATPLGIHLEDWLKESNYTARTKADHRHAIGRLTEWLDGAKLTVAVETLTDRVAGRFKTEALVNTNVNRKTANKLLSGLRTYWKWLMANGHAGVNPWSGKSLPKPRAGTVDPEELERPFTDAELVALLNGGGSEEMLQVMWIGALSGMREEEIFQLKVRDCADSVFNVRRSKTGAGQRKVPIHSKLEGIVVARCKGKGAEDYLFHEANNTGWGGTRSMAFSKRFATYRKKLGVHEVIEGKRRSLVNFHSFRRWFATKAEQAGNLENIVHRVLGQKLTGMAFGTYSGGALEGQLRKCVESVRAPKGSSSFAAKRKGKQGQIRSKRWAAKTM
jgi:integrase